MRASPREASYFLLKTLNFINFMRNRKLLNSKLERMDDILNSMNSMLNQMRPVSEYRKGIEDMKQLVEDVTTMIAREPMGPGE